MQQSRRRHNLAGRAVPALESIVFDEGRLHRMQFFPGRKPFDRRDLVAVMHHGQSQAGVDATPVYMDRASAALAVVSALLGSE